MVQARGCRPILTHLNLSDAELRTIEALACGKSLKEISYIEHVTEACISARVKRAMARNGFSNKSLFIMECIRLLNRQV